MNAVSPMYITSAVLYGLPFDAYKALEGLNFSSLKEMKRSPQHYRHNLANPRETAPMRLGTAAHMAVLEPERFAAHHAVWTNRTDSGAMSPRRGKAWDEFVSAHAGKDILTADEYDSALAIQAAVRSNATAMRYLRDGHPEVTIIGRMHDRACKARADWLTEVDKLPHLIGVKTARDCRHFVFGKQAAVLGYHMQWAWYHDLYAATHNGVSPMMKEIVVESAAPHATAVYHITDDIIDQGREDFIALLEKLDECERTNHWPGPVDGEEDLTLPTWAYTQSPEDLADLELET